MVDARESFHKEMKRKKKEKVFLQILYYTLCIIAIIGILFVIYIKFCD